jgi:cell division protein FtsB
MATATARAPRRRASAGLERGGIRWDRLSRVALLVLLGGILLMYVSPAKHWWEASRTASAQSQELSHLEAENRALKERSALLQDPDTLELEARKLGMTRSDERAFSIERLPR